MSDISDWRSTVYPCSQLSWGDLLHNSIRSIMNVRFFRNYRKILFHQIYKLAQDFDVVWSKDNYLIDVEESGIGIFYKIRACIKFLRFSFFKMFSKFNLNNRQGNTFFHPLRKFNGYQFLWFTEFNLGSLLIKLKFSTSLYFSRFILKNSWVFINNHDYLYMYSLMSPNTYLQFIIGFRVFLFLKMFFLKFFSLLRFFSKYLWLLNKSKKNIFFDNKKKKILNTFLYFGVFEINFTKLFEMDYTTLTFIFLPPLNQVVLINYIHFLWANHWNHKIVTWKYLT